MAGRVIRVYPRNQIDLSNITSASTTEIALVKDVDISGLREGALLVRMHAKDLTAPGKFEIVLRPTAPTSDEPNAIFQAPSADILATITDVATAGMTAPVLTRIPLTDTKAGWMTIYARVTGSGGSNKATLSMDLVAKD